MLALSIVLHQALALVFRCELCHVQVLADVEVISRWHNARAAAMCAYTLTPILSVARLLTFIHTTDDNLISLRVPHPSPIPDLLFRVCSWCYIMFTASHVDCYHFSAPFGRRPRLVSTCSLKSRSGQRRENGWFGNWIALCEFPVKACVPN